MRTVAVDTSVLINLAHADRLALLGRIPGLAFVVPEEVMAEVTSPDQRAALLAVLGAGVVQRAAISDLAAIELYAELRVTMGRGEAACLALAVSKGWLVACDERRAFRREALARLGSGRLITTPGLLVLAIRAGLMTVEEADRAKALLERHRFRMTFGSFRGLQ